MPTREHLFKAKRKDNGEWVEGYYCPTPYTRFPCKPSIYPADTINTDWHGVEVDPETICEYTGLTDKNGKRIFEGDIVVCRIVGIREEIIHRGFVEYIEDCFAVNIKGIVPAQQIISFSIKNGDIEVIGNIYDNPELLEETHE